MGVEDDLDKETIEVLNNLNDEKVKGMKKDNRLKRNESLSRRSN